MTLSRRGFLAAVAACAVAACSRAARPTFAPVEDGLDLPMPEVEVEQLPDGAVFPLGRALPLRSPFSPILVVLRAEGTLPVRAAVLRDEGGRLLAIRAECPDLGTHLRPRRTGHVVYWQSARHGSRFSLDATRILRGPARHLPARLLVQETDGMVVVRNVPP